MVNLSTVECYDIDKDVWTLMPPMKTARMGKELLCQNFENLQSFIKVLHYLKRFKFIFKLFLDKLVFDR